MAGGGLSLMNAIISTEQNMRDCSAASHTVEMARLSSSSPPSSSHCAGSLEWKVSKVRRAGGVANEPVRDNPQD